MKRNQADMTGQGSHQFHFSKESVATCACGRWAMTKIPMTAARAQQVAKRYGKARFGPQADLILKAGVPFTTLSQEEGLKGWEDHIKNLPERGARVNGCASIRQKRREGQFVGA